MRLLTTKVKRLLLVTLDTMLTTLCHTFLRSVSMNAGFFGHTKAVNSDCILCEISVTCSYKVTFLGQVKDPIQ